ncbi:MAG: hypothetical protein IE934_14515 [Sphingopyxis sp.]|nr:hypothetical protein [Sphingopyxis sp.]
MAEQITIASLVRDAKNFADREELPFAEEPWTEDSRIIWRAGDETEAFETEGQTFSYFLEPFIIVEQFSNWPDSGTLVDRVIDYARSDA